VSRGAAASQSSAQTLPAAPPDVAGADVRLQVKTGHDRFSCCETTAADPNATRPQRAQPRARLAAGHDVETPGRARGLAALTPAGVQGPPDRDGYTDPVHRRVLQQSPRGPTLSTQGSEVTGSQRGTILGRRRTKPATAREAPPESGPSTGIQASSTS